MICPDCQRSVPSDSRFCSYCGQLLKQCLNCDIVFGEDADFCGRCGGSLAVAPPTFTPPEPVDDDVRAFLYDTDDPSIHHPLQRGDNTIGAGGANDVVVDHPAVSWNHAVIICRNDQVFIQDSASTNGTFVDDDRVQKPHRLRHGAQVRFGERAFAVWFPPSMRQS